MHPIIELFFKCYLQWVAMDHPETKTFVNRYGLCGNLSKLCHRWSMRTLERETIIHELSMMFKRDGLDSTFPFNNGSHKAFQHELYAGYGCMNAERLEWVKKQIPDFEPDGLMVNYIGWLSSYRGGYETSNIRWEDIQRLSLDDGSSVRTTFRRSNFE